MEHVNCTICNPAKLTAELENAAVLLAKEWKVMIRVLQLSKHKGRNYARNVGVREATGPVVAIFDAHVEFGFDWWVETCNVSHWEG